MLGMLSSPAGQHVAASVVVHGGAAALGYAYRSRFIHDLPRCPHLLSSSPMAGVDTPF